jgi:hypothetical protein
MSVHQVRMSSSDANLLQPILLQGRVLVNDIKIILQERMFFIDALF